MLGRVKLGWIKQTIAGLSIVFGFGMGLSMGLSSYSFAEDVEGGSLVVVHQGIPHDALYDVCFDGDRGLAVGIAGTVLSSSDAGLTWQPQPPLASSALLGVSCDGKTSIAVGQSGYIQTKSASGDWQTVSSGSDQRILSVSANDQGLAVAVGGFGTVLRSRDAGATWQPISFDWEAILEDFLEPHIYDVAVFNDDTILLVGEFELVLLSTDGGDTWEVVNKADSSLAAIYFSDRQNGYAVGQDGKVLKTVDGGLTWQILDVPTRENLLDIWASGTGDVLITGIRTLLRSSDAGASWEAITEGDVSVKWYQAVKGTPVAGEASYNIVMVGHSGRIVQIK
ncbi:MAG: hypothetical protein DRR06_11210 [Gammaproteobacteria bacterium]|nr:MAG: hypothetical protein DRR06_11210 [Gammaproteobacteria bacterium]RLA52897.1 MAG: hypothetical protein DRR42_06340 [Gammaproteobacteria bacterium]